MADSALKRQRRLDLRQEDGSVLAFLYLRRARAGLSRAEWRSLSPGAKLERLFSMSPDDMGEILSLVPR
jgi:hypothetical protein